MLINFCFLLSPDRHPESSRYTSTNTDQPGKPPTSVESPNPSLCRSQSIYYRSSRSHRKISHGSAKKIRQGKKQELLYQSKKIKKITKIWKQSAGIQSVNARKNKGKPSELQLTSRIPRSAGLHVVCSQPCSAMCLLPRTRIRKFE